jgi:hypothetical protein
MNFYNPVVLIYTIEITVDVIEDIELRLKDDVLSIVN